MRNKSTSEICQRNTALTKCYIVKKKDIIRDWKQSTESQKKTPDIISSSLNNTYHYQPKLKMSNLKSAYLYSPKQLLIQNCRINKTKKHNLNTLLLLPQHSTNTPN